MIYNIVIPFYNIKNIIYVIYIRKDDMIETTRTKGKRNSKLYYEDELKISPLDNASNRAKYQFDK